MKTTKLLTLDTRQPLYFQTQNGIPSKIKFMAIDDSHPGRTIELNLVEMRPEIASMIEEIEWATAKLKISGLETIMGMDHFDLMRRLRRMVRAKFKATTRFSQDDARISRALDIVEAILTPYFPED